MIFFKDGAVVHAMCDQETGESAFFTILSFNGGSLQNIRGVQPPIVSIHKNIESLLFEAALKDDEKSAAEAQIPTTLPVLTDSIAHRSDDEQQPAAKSEEPVQKTEPETKINTQPDDRYKGS